VRLRPTTEDLLLSVRLVDVSPGGAASLVTYGTLRASQRASASDPDTLTPGEAHDLSVPLRPASHVFEPGHRLRVAVGAGFFPRLLAPREHGSLTLLSTPDAPSGVTVPGTVHDGDARFPNAVDLPDPDESLAPVASPFVADSRGEFETARDHPSGRATVRTDDETEIDLPHGPTMRYAESVEWVARPRDPAGVRVRSRMEAELEYETDVVRAETTARTGQDGAALSQTVSRDGEPLLEEAWRL